ncbi:pickpocket protein 28 isoform X2 [Nasonia vitripennis]|uniref:Uncharacterized protein n=1 Tax=Nasonia vitripennis TaxID=7425 RepID=A0A7M7HBD4_NASVI|nr:pickpocket protein 28 isoform X2 [Nasonia vitripennis]
MNRAPISIGTRIPSTFPSLNQTFHPPNFTKMHPRNLIRWLEAYLKSSNIHGLKYIVEKNYHWTERLFWLIMCVLSWYACVATVLSINRNFVEKPVAITVDTSYLDWQSPFPTIAICSSFNQAAKEFAASLINKYSNKSLNAHTLSEQLFLPSRMGYLKRLEKLNIPAEDYVAVYDRVEPNCSETFIGCSWNGKAFNCCNEFVTLHTAVGYCQMLNSKHAKPANPAVDFSVNRTHRYAQLSFDFTERFKKANSDIQIFFLNNVEIPTISTSNNKILKNIERVVGIEFNILDIVNESGVRNTPPDKRECRFPEENEDTLIYKLYSFDGCITDIDVHRMQESCDCISYAYPRKAGLRVCNMTGMRCIGEYRREGQASSSSSCLPDCEGASVDWYTYELINEESTRGSGLRMRMLSMPHMRYQRYVVRSLLDVVVASGSSIGLFTGASVLSVVELFYWLLFRPRKSG